MCPPKYCAHNLPRWKHLLEFLFLIAMKCVSMPWTVASFRYSVQNCCLVSSGSTVQEVTHFILSDQCTALMFVVCCSISIFSIQCEHNFRCYRKKWTWNLYKMLGKWYNGESPISSVFFNCTLKIIIQQRHAVDISIL